MSVLGHDVPAWLAWALAFLAASGLWSVTWKAATWLERAAGWLLRDRVAELLEDDGDGEIVRELTRLGLPPDHDWDPDCRVQGCPVHSNWLPPERTWEQMTSHQLPVVDWPRACPSCGSRGPHRDGCDVYAPARERRAPWWEAEHRAAYESLGFDYPSGLMARVRELTP